MERQYAENAKQIGLIVKKLEDWFEGPGDGHGCQCEVHGSAEKGSLKSFSDDGAGFSTMCDEKGKQMSMVILSRN
jgi:hypothetical protein